MFSSQEILAQLDSCSKDFTFPMLDNGYVYPAGTNLRAYGDENRWVIVIECIGFSYRGGGHNGISNCLHIFGNCLAYEPGTQNENFLYITGNAKDGDTFDSEEDFYLEPACKTFLLRGEDNPVIHYRGKYLEDNERINAFEFLRLLDKMNHEKLVATEEEIRTRIPSDIPQVLQFRDWFHPDLVNEELPSENETFQMIADVLVKGNKELYKPSHKANTHWSNWPDGGTL